MTISAAPSALATASAFSGVLRDWRRRRRVSQLELSLTCGVTQRHVSFLESGRSRPSRRMVMQLSEALDVPLRERNDWLLAAGFAPLFPARRADDPQMAQVMGAVHRMLDSHAPYPALAVDRAWNLRLANPPFEMLVDLLGSDVWDRVGGAQRNLMRLLFHPQGLRPWIANWTEVASLLWHRARREADAIGGEEMKAVLAELLPLQDDATLHAAEGHPLLPVLPLVLEKDGMRMSLFTVIATFGTAQDVTTDEMRIEFFFPSDEATEEMLKAAAGTVTA